MGVIFIEFQNEKPFSVHDGEYQHDVEFSERDGEYYYNSSSSGHPHLEGSNNKWWAIDGVIPNTYSPEGEKENAPETNRVEKLPDFLTDECGNTLNIEDWAIEDMCLLCSECNDWIPSLDLCKHIWWDEEGAWFSTPSERD